MQEFLNILDFQHGQGNNNLINEMTPFQLEEVYSLIPTSTETVKAFLGRNVVKDFSAAEISYNLRMKFSKFDKGNMLIFYPGDQVQDKLSNCANKFKDVIKSEVIVKATVMKITSANQLMQDNSLNFLAISQLQRKVFFTGIGNSIRL